ncbi:MAG TPA: hypothetical protein VLG47_00350 [Candidatus Saccharimonadales bacterium]|nr:hypothetical protein [Candidatus Saccharimonadales bacterium]
MAKRQAIKTLPWGEEIFAEISLNKKSQNKFYARHGINAEGKEYVEFAKFGPRPNSEDETYLQKLRLYSPKQWAQIYYYVEHELAPSIGWDLRKAMQEFEASLTEESDVHVPTK